MSAILNLVLAALTATPLAGREPAPAEPTSLIATWIKAQREDRPRINVWVNREDPYQRGDNARVYFRSDRDAYVTVIRIDTDGRMRVLFPIDPWEDNFARGGRTFEVLGRDRDEAFRVDDYPGVGYIFAISSGDEFRYDDIVRGDHWDYRAISDGRVQGDPYVAVSDLADRIAQQEDYDYDVASYDVERHYDYPRFVCYDCHTYASWHYWDPYSSYCSRFRIVIYDDWYYYPYRRYRGGVYYGRPYRPGPRYVFKDADKRNDYITRVAERPRGGDPVRRTSADVGGRGSIPAPVSPRRRTDDGNRGAEPGRAPSNDPRRRTEGGNRPDGTRPDASPDREPRRRTDDNGNRPDAGRPDAGRPDASPDREPRRRSDDNGNRPDAGRPDAGRPDASPDREPRRRGRDNGNRPDNFDAAPEREPSNQLRETRPERGMVDDRPSRDNGMSAERRGRRARDEGDNPGLSEPRIAPDRGGSRVSPDRGGARDTPDRGGSREPRMTREPRSEPRAEPRSPPRSEPRAEPRQSPPERRAEPRGNSGGGGAPELRRRRP